MGLRLFEGNLPIRDTQYVEASSLKERGQAINDVRIVIGEQDGRFLAGHF
jgi:hypothetical protein